MAGSILSAERQMTFVLYTLSCLVAAGSAQNASLLGYEQLWQWEDRTTAFYTKHIRRYGAYVDRFWVKPFCGILSSAMHEAGFSECNLRRSYQLRGVTGALCEFEPAKTTTTWPQNQPLDQIKINMTVNFPAFQIDQVTCVNENGPSGVTHRFLACGVLTDCWMSDKGRDVNDICPMGQVGASFPCRKNHQHVHYMFVCDHRQDCIDNSDESFCVFPLPCQPGATFDCGNFQCIPVEQKCDFIVQCVSGADEAYCLEQRDEYNSKFNATLPPPAIVNMDQRGLLVVEALGEEKYTGCPSTHFECLVSPSYCLPVYLRCNSVHDCQGYEDEAGCDDYVCPGFYRCLKSHICVHAEHVCDGKLGQCPQNDDELLCGVTCPEGCTCYGMVFHCSRSFSAGQFAELRYLDAERTNMTLRSVKNNTMLIHLSLAKCFLTSLKVPYLPNLQSLDLSDNQISHTDSSSFSEIPKLHMLRLGGNPLNLQVSLSAIISLLSLQLLDLSQVHIPHFNSENFKKLVGLEVLNLSHSGITEVSGRGFQTLPNLRSLDLSMCPVIHFPHSLLKNLSNLQSLTASNFTMCCPEVLPKDFNPSRCIAPHDEVSSCHDLIGSNTYRIVFILLATVSLLGNAAVTLFHVLVEKQTQRYGFVVCVIHLCVSDFLQGMYLLLIVLADVWYDGTYLWYAVTWKNSTGCKAAKFLFSLSLEVSMFLICINTLYVLLLHRNYSTDNSPLSWKPVHVCNIVAWVFGAVLSAWPLVPVTSQLQNYNQAATCIPLSMTGTNDAQYTYTFGIFTVLNVVLSIVAGAVQGRIYYHVSSNIVLMTNTNRQSTELIIARRLSTVAMTSILCLLSVGLLGLGSTTGVVSVPVKMWVGMVMLVLPLHASLNPCLYTVNTLTEQQRKRRQQYLLSVLSRQKAGT